MAIFLHWILLPSLIIMAIRWTVARGVLLERFRFHFSCQYNFTIEMDNRCLFLPSNTCRQSKTQATHYGLMIQVFLVYTITNFSTIQYKVKGEKNNGIALYMDKSCLFPSPKAMLLVVCVMITGNGKLDVEGEYARRAISVCYQRDASAALNFNAVSPKFGFNYAARFKYKNLYVTYSRGLRNGRNWQLSSKIPSHSRLYIHINPV